MKEFTQYLCDYCGKPFPTKNACSKHEEKCKEVVQLVQYELCVDEGEGIETNSYSAPARPAHHDPDTCYFLGESADDPNYHDRFVDTENVSINILSRFPLCITVCCYRLEGDPAPWDELKADALGSALQIKIGAEEIIKRLEEYDATEA